MEDKNSEISITEKLSWIQSQLKAPKSQFNKFGNYSYRKAEDILEAVKPLLREQGLALIIRDEIVAIEGRIYVKATTVVFDDYNEVVVSAFAREEESKKGMDGSQVTGAASSYARKYALNGMFCIDDTADSDATNTHGKTPPPNAPVTTPQQQITESNTIMDKAVAYVKSQRDKKKAFDMIMSKYGNDLTEAQKNGLKKFVR